MTEEPRRGTMAFFHQIRITAPLCLILAVFLLCSSSAWDEPLIINSVPSLIQEDFDTTPDRVLRNGSFDVQMIWIQLGNLVSGNCPLQNDFVDPAFPGLHTCPHYSELRL